MVFQMSNTGSDAAVFCVVDIPFGGIVSAAPAGFAAVIGLPAVWQSVAVDEIAAPAPGTKTLIFYPGLTAALHNALTGGTPPETALADWQAMAEALLAFYRRRRMTAFLAEVGTLEQDPAGLRARLAGWVGPLPDPVLPDPVLPDTLLPDTLFPDPGLSGADNANDETADLARIMTATVLLASRDLRRLNDELAAGGFALRPPALDTGAPLQAIAGLWGRLGTATAATKLLETQASTLMQQAERDAAAAQALRAQLEAAERDRATLTAARAELLTAQTMLKAAQTDLTAANAGLQQRVTQLDTERSALAQTAADLEQQVLSLQEVLEHEFGNQSTLRATIDAFNGTEKPQFERRVAELTEAQAHHKQQMQDMERDLQTLRDSLQARDGRIMALNRDLQAREAELESGLAHLQAEQAASQAEQQALRDSLQDREGRILALNRDLQAREAEHDRRVAELESGLAQLQAEQAASQAEQQTERAMLMSKVADLRRQTGERDQKLAAQRIEIELMQAEVARFYNSLSWKVTAPMRAIRRGFDSLRNHKG